METMNPADLKEALEALITEYGGECDDFYHNQCQCLDELRRKLALICKSL